MVAVSTVKFISFPPQRSRTSKQATALSDIQTMMVTMVTNRDCTKLSFHPVHIIWLSEVQMVALSHTTWSAGRSILNIFCFLLYRSEYWKYAKTDL
jgi:hypothetical protein